MTRPIAGAHSAPWFLAAALGLVGAPAPAQAAVSKAAHSQATLSQAVVDQDRAASPTSVEALARAVSPSIVTVSVVFKKRPTGRPGTGTPDVVRIVRPGSGFIVHPSGLVVTNLHLVGELRGPEADEYWAIVTVSGGPLPGGRQYDAQIVAVDERTDLALLQLEGGATRLPALPLGDPAALAPGERVVALGFPDGQLAEVFAGVIAPAGGPVRLRDQLLDAADTVLSDARFHTSLDGGPLVDLSGRVIGIHNSSHVSERSQAFGDEDPGELMKKDVEDYAVIVSATAVQRAFERWLPRDEAPLAPAQRGAPFRAVAAVAAVAPSIVSVWTGEGEHPAAPSDVDPHGQRLIEGLGSGVVFTASGLVVTSDALFPGDTQSANVRAADGASYTASLVTLRRARQIALVQVALPDGVTLAPAPLADPAGALAGEFVAVVARPCTQTMLSFGVLSALERAGVLQVASWLHRGHLGGAVVDQGGRVLGVAVSEPPLEAGRVKSTSYLGFACPLSGVLDGFKTELAAAGLAAPAADSADAVEARRNAAARVVAATKGSLVNVLVSKARPTAPKGFDPFAEDEPEFLLLGQGSGAIIDPSGLALTNWHVVSAALDGTVPREDHKVEVTLPTGERYDALVLSTSRDDDLALIALQLEPGRELVPVALGDSAALRVGQPVIAIGNPLGLADSVTLGVVSRTSIDARIQGRLREYKGMVQVDAAINPGNSGGALLDEDARLVGINSAGRVGAGMAIPVDKAREVFAGKLLAAESLRSAFVGFEVDEHGGEAGASSRLVVRAVDALGPAGRAGLVIGDELLSIDGREGLGRVALAQTLLAAAPGAPLALRIGRRGETREVSLTPLPFAAWNAFRQSGVLVTPVDYVSEHELVHTASIALHRAYTGDANGAPSRLMSGALRVDGVRSLDGATDHPVRAGDLLLGLTHVTRGAVTDVVDLLRFEDLSDLATTFDERATKEGELCELWLYRDGAVTTAKVWIRRPPRTL